MALIGVLLQPSNMKGCTEKEGANLLYKPGFVRIQHNKWQEGKVKPILEKIVYSKGKVLE